jgi:hypothetical protein
LCGLSLRWWLFALGFFLHRIFLNW